MTTFSCSQWALIAERLLPLDRLQRQAIDKDLHLVHVAGPRRRATPEIRAERDSIRGFLRLMMTCRELYHDLPFAVPKWCLSDNFKFIFRCHGVIDWPPEFAKDSGLPHEQAWLDDRFLALSWLGVNWSKSCCVFERTKFHSCFRAKAQTCVKVLTYSPVGLLHEYAQAFKRDANTARSRSGTATSVTSALAADPSSSTTTTTVATPTTTAATATAGAEATTTTATAATVRSTRRIHTPPRAALLQLCITIESMVELTQFMQLLMDMQRCAVRIMCKVKIQFRSGHPTTIRDLSFFDLHHITLHSSDVELVNVRFYGVHEVQWFACGHQRLDTVEFVRAHKVLLSQPPTTGIPVNTEALRGVPYVVLWGVVPSDLGPLRRATGVSLRDTYAHDVPSLRDVRILALDKCQLDELPALTLNSEVVLLTDQNHIGALTLPAASRVRVDRCPLRAITVGQQAPSLGPDSTRTHRLPNQHPGTIHVTDVHISNCQLLESLTVHDNGSTTSNRACQVYIAGASALRRLKLMPRTELTTAGCAQFPLQCLQSTPMHTMRLAVASTLARLQSLPDDANVLLGCCQGCAISAGDAALQPRYDTSTNVNTTTSTAPPFSGSTEAAGSSAARGTTSTRAQLPPCVKQIDMMTITGPTTPAQLQAFHAQASTNPSVAHGVYYEANLLWIGEERPARVCGDASEGAKLTEPVAEVADNNSTADRPSVLNAESLSKLKERARAARARARTEAPQMYITRKGHNNHINHVRFYHSRNYFCYNNNNNSSSSSTSSTASSTSSSTSTNTSTSTSTSTSSAAATTLAQFGGIFADSSSTVAIPPVVPIPDDPIGLEALHVPDSGSTSSSTSPSSWLVDLRPKHMHDGRTTTTTASTSTTTTTTASTSTTTTTTASTSTTTTTSTTTASISSSSSGGIDLLPGSDPLASLPRVDPLAPDACSTLVSEIESERNNDAAWDAMVAVPEDNDLAMLLPQWNIDVNAVDSMVLGDDGMAPHTMHEAASLHEAVSTTSSDTQGSPPPAGPACSPVQKTSKDTGLEALGDEHDDTAVPSLATTPHCDSADAGSGGNLQVTRDGGALVASDDRARGCEGRGEKCGEGDAVGVEGEGVLGKSEAEDMASSHSNVVFVDAQASGAVTSKRPRWYRLLTRMVLRNAQLDRQFRGFEAFSRLARVELVSCTLNHAVISNIADVGIYMCTGIASVRGVKKLVANSLRLTFQSLEDIAEAYIVASSETYIGHTANVAKCDIDLRGLRRFLQRQTRETLQVPLLERARALDGIACLHLTWSYLKKDPDRPYDAVLQMTKQRWPKTLRERFLLYRQIVQDMKEKRQEHPRMLELRLERT
ncbi:hypothetical protein PTSG_08899 [Salpingoeca rosetta]|uniref:Uncharacterized protein n=1 Tax=Salpingoeca rosetta (strain ATCC 50818 / BSB-021) TaxID=946362 RepID=F2UL10_SALR5|nr:uncharacterized protein PTSG_08899 [Salpingoeca rosetta]EGD77809.1 hypothetical protein PTSG_08899 [Salpingoeca rosetta]|eukprot:XP_004990285.1 hypothetical protein PTSG_08899 [Salpingoeca rosetta]